MILQLHPSTMPKVRGTADVDGGAYLPFLPLSRTHSRCIIIQGLLTDGLRQTRRVIEADAAYAPY